MNCRLILDVACGREAFQRHDISNIRIIRSSNNLADGLTKRMQRSELREAIKESSKIKLELGIIANVD